VVVLGAGPAGLSAAYELTSHGLPCVVLEKDSVVGGLARTVEYKGCLFDIGGHRFFTKVPLVERMWREVLGEDLLVRPRLSRIYYRSKFFHYPLEPLNALKGLGLLEALRCVLSYLWRRISPLVPEDNFEAWIANRFGSRLFEIFFQHYTEKVWGIPCRQIGAEWAAQRIRGLSLTSLVRHALFPNGHNGRPKTLTQQFYYPRRGPGMMWSKTCEIVESRGARVLLEAPVEKILWEPGRVTGVVAGGTLHQGRHFISSLPIRDLIERLDPAPPDYLRAAARDFNYRDFLTVVLVLRARDLFADNWIYVHDPDFRVGRVQNFNNWSPDMTPDPGTTCLGLEYFCFQGDELWCRSDRELLDLAGREIAALGLADARSIVDGVVVRAPKAYPIYDDSYQHGLAAVKRFLETVPNLQLVGRNGMHRYNNQDHSMLTAILAARNIMGAHHDLWRVNLDPDYHEDGEALNDADLRALIETQPRVPERKVTPAG
jgi:protoporphyrinogen oxidase